MADLQILDCVQPELVLLERVRYFPRQLLTPEDMTTDQDYFRQKLRRHNRFLHGWGVVCGLEVTVAAPSPEAPWTVEIGPGYALGPYGDEIYVAEPIRLDLAQCGPGAATSPCEPDMLQQPGAVAAGALLYVAIKYAECVSRPVRAMPAGCACEEVECEYSRIRDSFEIGCLTELPILPEDPLICALRRQNRLPACPPCPTEPWVVLAEVHLPALGAGITHIDNVSVRRQLYRTALLQEQLIACCCEERPAPPPVPVQATVVNVKADDQFQPPESAPTHIEITFNKALAANVVNVNTVLVLENDKPVSGTVIYSDTERRAIFTPGSRFGKGDYVITVRGTGTGLNRIVDVDGLALDGNRDTHGGDDLEVPFRVRDLT